MANDRQTLVKLIQDSIDKGATTVEEIHKSIADLPLKILEGSELLKGPAKDMRHLRDHRIGAIYDVIRKVNEEVGNLASELLAEAAKRRAAGPAGGSTRHAARREITSIRKDNRNAKSQKRKGAKQGSAVRRA